jgi:hypothetical protein
LNAPGARVHPHASRCRVGDTLARSCVWSSPHGPPNAEASCRDRLGTEIADVQDQQVGRRCRDMRAVALYMLGVPVFLIVILWLFGVV